MFDDISRAIGVKDIFSISDCVVQLISDHTVSVLNMLGLVLLEKERIELKMSNTKKLIICGENLVCEMLNPNEITIKGIINTISLEKF